uniref:Uncharacterized protein n=1 Tax=Cacopsylla melanoneura TaxID=428564 RepID=A0A8D9EN80_9HEMI
MVSHFNVQPTIIRLFFKVQHGMMLASFNNRICLHNMYILCVKIKMYSIFFKHVPTFFFFFYFSLKVIVPRTVFALLQDTSSLYLCQRRKTQVRNFRSDRDSKPQPPSQ